MGGTAALDIDQAAATVAAHAVQVHGVRIAADRIAMQTLENSIGPVGNQGRVPQQIRIFQRLVDRYPQYAGIDSHSRSSSRGWLSLSLGPASIALPTHLSGRICLGDCQIRNIIHNWKLTGQWTPIRKRGNARGLRERM